MEKNYVVHGHLCYTPTPEEVTVVENGWLVCEDGKISGVFEKLPGKFDGMEILDYTGCLIIPGLTDLHLHAPQYSFRSLGMDMELMDWLNTHTFPEEAKYCDMEYALRAYTIFAEDMKKSATTRAAVFATLHVPATRLLMDLLDKTGIIADVGKVNMDRNCPEFLCESGWREAARSTRDWLESTLGAYNNIKPIITPRFTPACSPKLMSELGKMQKEYGVPVQSHLSENPGEIQLVQQLHPDSRFYGETYEKAGLFGENGPVIMAHCIYSSAKEVNLMKEREVFVAHCPQSNMNLASGLAPARWYMDNGLSMGLGSDIAGGYSLSIFRAMADAISMSKMYWRHVDEKARPLSAAEAFYLGTKGGGAFFGKCGSFELGYDADFVVLDDTRLPSPMPLDVRQRLERMIFLSDDRHIKAKYVRGTLIQ